MRAATFVPRRCLDRTLRRTLPAARLPRSPRDRARPRTRPGSAARGDSWTSSASTRINRAVPGRAWRRAAAANSVRMRAMVERTFLRSSCSPWVRQIPVPARAQVDPLDHGAHEREMARGELARGGGYGHLEGFIAGACRSSPRTRPGQDTFPTHGRRKIRRLESPTLARQSVTAALSEFGRAELEAFVATVKRQRPSAWSRVEQLQQACRREGVAGDGGRPRPLGAGAGEAERRLSSCRRGAG